MRLADIYDQSVGPEVPVSFRGYDDSESIRTNAVATVSINSPKALHYLVTAPGDLGFARAYVSGSLDFEGDLHAALRQIMNASNFDWRGLVSLVRHLGADTFRRSEPPPEEIKLHGWRHSKTRDQAAVSYHYDVSNAFYELLLGPSMAYTCAFYPSSGDTLEEAQFAKFDRVSQKLDLQAGMNLLDVGCGWGGMVMHSARNYDVNALGATLSQRQAEWATKTIADEGLGAQAQVRHQDYRDVEAKEFDVISSIGLTEHIGAKELPKYFQHLYVRLKPGGRLLNHSIQRPIRHLKRLKQRGFMNRYVFPDAEIPDVGEVIDVMQSTGFEVRHHENLREHYTQTLRAWYNNLDQNWGKAVDDVGEGRARVWRLYIAISEILFATNRMQLHQVLAIKPASLQGEPPTWSSWRWGLPSS